MFDKPVTRASANSSRNHLSSHTRLRVRTAPSSTTFSGHSLIFEASCAFRPIQQASPMKTFSDTTTFSPSEHREHTTSVESSALCPTTTSFQSTTFLSVDPGPITQLSPITLLEMWTSSPRVTFFPRRTVPLRCSRSRWNEHPSPN